MITHCEYREYRNSLSFWFYYSHVPRPRALPRPRRYWLVVLILLSACVAVGMGLWGMG